MQRISLISLNLWNTEHWEQREQCIVSFVQTYDSDIYCFQEVRPKSLKCLDEALPAYIRIEGTEIGWTRENSIYIKKDLFSVLNFGRIDLQMPEPERGVFWVELETKEKEHFFVATMHLTHQLNADEKRTGIGYRHHEAHLAAKALNALVMDTSTIICGDFNDPVHPSRIFQEEAHFQDVFTLLGIPAPITFPCPFLTNETYLVEAIDKIMVRGAIKPIIATSPHYLVPGQVLSDHWPVATVIQLSSSIN